jgi:hypothetical protein
MTKSPSSQNLKRKIQPIPGFVRDALKSRRLVGKCKARPAYQRNDYLLWINTGKSQPTRQSGWIRCWTSSSPVASI